MSASTQYCDFWAGISSTTPDYSAYHKSSVECYGHSSYFGGYNHHQQSLAANEIGRQGKKYK